jgi:hypothetical protein
MQPAVLLDEPSYGVKTAVHADDTDVIGAARQRRGHRPAIARWIVDVVIGPVDALLRLPADKVQMAHTFGGPSHFAAWQR